MKKEKQLEEIINDYSLSEKLKEGIKDLKDQCYEQAWDCFQQAHKHGASEEEKGKACYLLYCLMENVEDEDIFVANLQNKERGLSRIMSQKEVGPAYPRRYVARKYLEKSAQYRYYLGLIDYSLLCVGYGTFGYKNEMKNLDAGLNWANTMKSEENDRVKAIANVIYAKYYYFKRNDEYKESVQRHQSKGEKEIPNKETFSVKEFGKCVIEANELCPENEFVQFYLAILHSNILFSGYENGLYYNPEKGYRILCELVDSVEEESLKEEILDVKKVIEKYYPQYKNKD